MSFGFKTNHPFFVSNWVELARLSVFAQILGIKAMLTLPIQHLQERHHRISAFAGGNTLHAGCNLLDRSEAIVHELLQVWHR